MQIQPYSRTEALAVPDPDRRGPLAERVGPDGRAGRNGYAGQQPSANGHAPPAAAPALVLQPSYLQVLIEHCKKRWKLLVAWMALTSGVAYWMVGHYGKPMWRAEGSLQYSPNYSYSHKRLYTPPNIQTVIQWTKDKKILEKVRAETKIGASADEMQARLNVNVARQSDLITIQFDWPDREQAGIIAARIQALAIENYDEHRHKAADGILRKLDSTVADTQNNLFDTKDKLSAALDKERIFDLQTEKDNTIREIATLEQQISKARTEITTLNAKIQQVKAQIKTAETDGASKSGVLTSEQLSKLTEMRMIKERQVTRQREVNQAKIALKAKEEQHRNWLPLAQRKQVSRQEMVDLESEIDRLKETIEGSADIRRMDEELTKIEKELLESKQGASPQLRYRLNELEVERDAVPTNVAALEKSLAERRQWQKKLQAVDKQVMPLLQEINTLQQNLANLTLQKQEHAKIETNELTELTVDSAAAVGNSPVATNTVKILAAVFGVGLLLFVGFVAVRDMPRFAQTGENTAERMNLPVLAKYGQLAPLPAPRAPTPDLTNEQLRLLAERIAQSVSGDGAIVLFTPAVTGLRIEALVADLGCFCAQRGGKVLVFDARPLAAHPNSPAWVGPSGNGVEQHLVAYLDGQSDDMDSCFTPTLIQAIDYARGDLGKHLAGVMAMYRFRRLTHELRERYSLVLMITPARYRGGDDDFFTNVAEGIVVVLSEDANPSDVESYIQRLRGGSTPVYGAVTVPSGRA